ncbi:unnamed protein product, partial [Sphacelaria rigidula]
EGDDSDDSTDEEEDGDPETMSWRMLTGGCSPRLVLLSSPRGGSEREEEASDTGRLQTKKRAKGPSCSHRRQRQRQTIAEDDEHRHRIVGQAAAMLPGDTINRSSTPESQRKRPMPSGLDSSPTPASMADSSAGFGLGGTCP